MEEMVCVFFSGPNQHLHLESIFGHFGRRSTKSWPGNFFRGKGSREVLRVDSSQEFLLKYGQKKHFLRHNIGFHGTDTHTHKHMA